jgi:hypothetical protein
MPDQIQPHTAFRILPVDHEVVAKIAALIPLEQVDRESMTTIIAGHRMIHAATSPNAETERLLALDAAKSIQLKRLLWACITKFGGSIELRDSDIPDDWNLEFDPIEDAKALRLVANRCAKSTAISAA